MPITAKTKIVMATVTDLKEVLKEHLQQSGALDKIRSQLRSEVFKALNEGEDPQNENVQISRENLLINELILEYLEFNNYNHSASVLMPESGMRNTRLSRDFVR